MSHGEVRAKPVWSAVIATLAESVHVPASMAGLPRFGACVFVDPPFRANAPRFAAVVTTPVPCPPGDAQPVAGEAVALLPLIVLFATVSVPLHPRPPPEKAVFPEIVESLMVAVPLTNTPPPRATVQALCAVLPETVTRLS